MGRITKGRSREGRKVARFTTLIRYLIMRVFNRRARLTFASNGVGYSVERGEIITRENDYQLIA